MMSMHVIYRPTASDSNGKWRRRRWTVDRNGLCVADFACDEADSLEAIRGSVPPGLFRLPRDSDDDPVIEELWI